MLCGEYADSVNIQQQVDTAATEC